MVVKQPVVCLGLLLYYTTNTILLTLEKTPVTVPYLYLIMGPWQGHTGRIRSESGYKRKNDWNILL